MKTIKNKLFLLYFYQKKVISTTLITDMENIKNILDLINQSKISKFNKLIYTEIHNKFNNWADQNLDKLPKQEIMHLSNLIAEKLNCEVRILGLIKENNELYLQNLFDPIYPQNTTTNTRINEIKKKWKTLLKNPKMNNIVDNSLLLPKDTIFYNKERIDPIFKYIINKFNNEDVNHFIASPGLVQRIYNNKILDSYNEKNTKNLLYFPIYDKDKTGKIIALAEISQWIGEEAEENSIMKNIGTLEKLISKGPNCLSERIGEGAFYDAKHCLDPKSSDVINYSYPYDSNYSVEEINRPAYRCPQLKKLFFILMKNVLEESYPTLTDNYLEAYFNCSKIYIIRNQNNKPVGFVAFDYLKELKEHPVYISAAFILQEAQSKGLLNFISLNFFEEELHKRKNSLFINPFKPNLSYIFRTQNPRVVELSSKTNPTQPNLIILSKAFNKVVKKEIIKSCHKILSLPKNNDNETMINTNFLKILFQDNFVILKNKNKKQLFLEDNEWQKFHINEIEKNPKKVAEYLLNGINTLTFNLKTIRKFENFEYKKNNQKYNILLQNLYETIRQTMKNNIKKRYRDLAEKKIRSSLGDGIISNDIYDDIFFIQKQVAPIMDNYENKNHATNPMINDFLHGMILCNNETKKSDLMMYVSDLSYFSLFKTKLLFKLKQLFLNKL